MLKRERDEGSDRMTGRSNGYKLQRTQEPERSNTEPMQAGSQDASGSVGATSFLARRTRQRSVSVPRHDHAMAMMDGDINRVENYKETRRVRASRVPIPPGESEKVMVRVPSESISRNNSQVHSRHFYGTDLYTHDSDLVCILLHCGYLSCEDAFMNNSFQEAQVVIEFLPGLPEYKTSCRHGIRSRTWGGSLAETGYSVKVVSCKLINKNGDEKEIFPRQSIMNGAPTFTLYKSDRPIATRSTASQGDRRHQRFCTELKMMYSLNNEPWLKYSSRKVADQGLKQSQFTTARLRTHCLYLENHKYRWELKLDPPYPGRTWGEEGNMETFRLSRIKKLVPKSKMMKIGIPAPREEIVDIVSCRTWRDFAFNGEGLWAGGVQFTVIRMLYMPRTIDFNGRPIAVSPSPDIGTSVVPPDEPVTEQPVAPAQPAIVNPIGAAI